jgi:hypothetical protein
MAVNDLYVSEWLIGGRDTKLKVLAQLKVMNQQQPVAVA